MIPVRVKLVGFLSYQDEQEVRFDDAQLWMLAGENGSGKSTVFDAITYALFGHHRGGSQQAHELINKNATGLRVEFDFRLDGSLYQARRTLKRNRTGSATGSQQLYAWESVDGNGKGHWVPIPDTNRKVDFEAWIRDHLGLNYETFTSSVLLLQGKAEKLLDSKPSGRAEVLASIVDLERYQQLHQKSDDLRKVYRARLDELQKRFGLIEEVSETQLAEAALRIREVSTARQLAQEHVDALKQQQYQAKQWREHQQRLAELQQRLGATEQLLRNRSALERDHRRWQELNAVLPHIDTILSERTRMAESERTTAQLVEQQGQLQLQQQTLDHTLEQAREQREILHRQREQDERELHYVGVELRELQGILTQLHLLEEHQTQFAAVEQELSAFLPDVPEQAGRLQAQLDACQAAAQQVSALERFARERDRLRDAAQRSIAAEAQESLVRQQGEEHRTRHDPLKLGLDRVIHEQDRLLQQVTEARTLWQQAQTARQEIDQLSGQKRCRQCGQTLTPGHLAEERQRRQHELDQAHAQHERLCQQLAGIRTQVDQLRLAVEQSASELTRLREAYLTARHQREQSGKDCDRHARECRQIYLEVPEEIRKKIAPQTRIDWSRTVFPTSEDLEQQRLAIAEQETLQQQLKQARKRHEHWQTLQARRETLRQTLARVQANLPKQDPGAVRQHHMKLQARERSLQQNLQASRQTLAQVEREVDVSTRTQTRLRQQQAEVQAELARQELTRSHSETSIEWARQLLPEGWRQVLDRAGLRQQLEWKQERDALTASKIAERFEQLRQASGIIEHLRQQLVEREGEAQAIPEAARRPVERIDAELNEALRMAQHREQDVQGAYATQRDLLRRKEESQQLSVELLEVEGEHKLYALLAQLLGRDYLQRHLVRQAERQIVDYANAVLDRLSAGELALRLVGSEEGVGADRALELEAYNRATGGSAINVTFLSGSQRFRVAVALAVGIGQYASKQHRPIESVIIDEGFGCLDRQGRQGMIQELQNLKGQLHCILLVSHQEEFAEAFPDGYHFALEDGATRVRRFQR